jgi:hypothetical protein
MKTDDFDDRIRESLEGVNPPSVDPGAIFARARSRQRRRRGAAVGLLGVTVLVAVAIAGSVGGGSGGPFSVPTVEASTQVRLPGEVVGTATGGEDLWVLACSSECGGPPSERSARGALVKIDGRTGEIVATTAVENPGTVAVGEGAVWVASFPRGVVTRFDPDTAEVTGTVEFGLPQPVSVGAPDAFEFLPNAIAAGEGSVWVSTARGYVAKIDPKDLAVDRTFKTPYSPGGVAVGGGSVWLSAGLFGVARIDATTDRLEDARPIEDAEGRRLSTDYLVVVDGSLWVRGGWGPLPGTQEYTAPPQGELGLARLDLESAEIDEIVSFDGFLTVRATSGSRLWLADRDSRAGSSDVYELDPAVGDVTLAARLAEPGTIVGAVGDSLWVARPEDLLQRYDFSVAVEP